MTICQYPKCDHGLNWGTCHICEGVSTVVREPVATGKGVIICKDEREEAMVRARLDLEMRGDLIAELSRVWNKTNLGDHESVQIFLMCFDALWPQIVECVAKMKAGK